MLSDSLDSPEVLTTINNTHYFIHFLDSTYMIWTTLWLVQKLNVTNEMKNTNNHFHFLAALHESNLIN